MARGRTPVVARHYRPDERTVERAILTVLQSKKASAAGGDGGSKKGSKSVLIRPGGAQR